MKYKMKNKRRIISIILIIIEIVSILLNFSQVKANIKEGDVIKLKGDHECDSLVEYYMTSHNKWSYKVVWYVYYEDEKTKERYPAFCVEPAKEGVGTGYTQYDGKISKETDNVIWRILSKGYMGSKYTDWNLECDDDFYSATKIALHSYKEGTNPKGKYILGNRSVDGNTVEEIQRRGQKVLDVAEELYWYGINNTKDVYQKPNIDIAKNEASKVEIINGEEYLVQKYKVNSNKYLKSYKINIENFTKGTIILNSNNEILKTDSEINNPNFKIAVPTKEIKNEINGTIKVENANVKTCPIFFAKSSIEGAQSYVTYTSSYETTNAVAKMQVDPNNCSLNLKKIDSQTKNPIANVTFEISNNEGEKIGEFTTNKNGIIQIDNLKPGIVKIKEIKVDNKYILDSEIKEVTLEWGKTAKIEIENKRKKGDLKIIKVDKENNEIAIEGIKFELYNEERKLLGTVETDKKGIIEIKDLDIGNYYLKEIETNEKYILDSEEKSIKIEWKNTTELKIENARKKGNLKIIKVDKENNEIAIEGVKFELYDMKEKLIKEITTDEKGEAKVENLDIGNYYLKETETNEKYILNEEKIQITINHDEETMIKIENARKKGDLKIIKVDKENNEIAIEGIKFELYNEERKLLGTVETDKKGIIEIKDLDIGNYYLKEIETNEKYILDSEEKSIKIEWKNTTELKIENARKKGNLKIIKVDKENNEIAIEGVKFELYDMKEKLIKEITTDEKGEAKVENLDIGNYYLKETETNEKYILNEEKIQITINHDEETMIKIENEKAKGKIKIIKISQDDNLINGKKAGEPIQGVVFEIRDMEDNIIETLITDEKGEIESSKLKKGKYKIKEIKTNEYYELNNEELIVEITENNQIIEKIITNKSKIKLPRTGF